MAQPPIVFYRKMHLYLGVFTAPAILFFALTGALQTFQLHETTKGSDYKPAKWITVLAQIHKHQSAVLPARRAAPPAATTVGQVTRVKGSGDVPKAALTTGVGEAKPAAGAEVKPSASLMLAAVRHPLPLRIFFLVVSIALVLSTGTGLVLAYRHLRHRGLMTTVLIAGVLVPVALVFV